MIDPAIKKMFPNLHPDCVAANTGPLRLTVRPSNFRPSPAPAKASPAISKEVPQSVKFTIPLPPIGKPRMTQRDRWYKDPNHADPKKRQRPAIARYEAWKESAKPHVPDNLPDSPVGVSWIAYIPFPKSYPERKRALLAGKHHCEKPDRDNIDKALCDFLFAQDKGIAFGTLCKRWDDGNGARIEIEVIK